LQEKKEQADLHLNDNPNSKPKLEPVAPPEKPSGFAMLKPYRKVLFIVLAVVVLVGGAAAWSYFSSYESTDDAQVDGHLHQISARISGTILNVNPAVEDSHYVEAGTVLAEIDPADYQADRDRAQADYARLQASSQAAEKDISVISSGSNGRLELANAAVSEAENSVAT